MTSMGRIAAAERRLGPRVVLARAPAAPVARLRPLREAIAELADDWTLLAAGAAEPNPFYEHWFVAAASGAAGDVRLLEVRRGPKLIGLMPIAAEMGYAKLPVRFAVNWRHDQMFVGTPLVAAGEEEAFWRAALDLLDGEDWPTLLHLRSLVEGGPVHRGLIAARNCAVAWREQRAFLRSDLSPQAYYEQAVRAKKRKELRRQSNRLAELGPVTMRRLGADDDLATWCDDYLRLERGGWKGETGTAFACSPPRAQFFRDVVTGARAAGRLQFLRLDLDEKAMAMLVNFRCPPGSFSFKTVFDEELARFSPGVLIQRENLAILDDAEIAWMDSCAAEDHPMIDSFWRERRSIVRVTVPLAGVRRRTLHAVCRALERAAATTRAALRKTR
ncbi:GNAT family N-acetyltransferase [Sphingosinicella sp.]|uniref:GNAT family N-acetyltransferase n=1 Tax=Sphingosinicella sp. TaxID=1917971 RepID=UPI00403783E5